MTAYILRRLLATIPVMAVVAVFVFFLLRLAPGDPAAIIAGEDATAEQIAAVRGKLGLDRPIFEQFVVWIAGMLQGDFGTSIFSNLPVSRLILQRLEPTVSLTLSTLLVAVCLAIPLGVLAAWKARRLVDRLVMGFAVMGFAMPVFLVGYVLIYVFAVQLGWLPVQGYKPIAEGLWPWAECLILPSLALGITYMALIARITRASMLEVLAQDYIRTANAKGFDRPCAAAACAQERRRSIVTVWHRYRPDLRCRITGPCSTSRASAGHRRCRAERVTRSWGHIIVPAAAKVLVNLIIDISYVFLDPRIRYCAPRPHRHRRDMPRVARHPAPRPPSPQPHDLLHICCSWPCRPAIAAPWIAGDPFRRAPIAAWPPSGASGPAPTSSAAMFSRAPSTAPASR
jgi:peptide/nickel transport system permease protein